MKVPREHLSSNSVAPQVEIPSNKEQSEQARQVGGGVEKAGRALVSCCTITFGASPYQSFELLGGGVWFQIGFRFGTLFGISTLLLVHHAVATGLSRLRPEPGKSCCCGANSSNNHNSSIPDSLSPPCAERTSDHKNILLRLLLILRHKVLKKLHSITIRAQF